MPEYIIHFPGDWYLRGTTAIKDIERADHFLTERDARKALAALQRHFIKTSSDAITVLKIGG